MIKKEKTISLHIKKRSYCPLIGMILTIKSRDFITFNLRKNRFRFSGFIEKKSYLT